MVLMKNVPAAMVLKFAPLVKKFVSGPQFKQSLCIQEGSADKGGVRALVNWMSLCCASKDPLPLKTPTDLLTAIQLHRELRAFLLFSDARHLNIEIEKTMRGKSLLPHQIADVWAKVPHDNEHVYMMVKNIHHHLVNKTLMDREAVKKVVVANPELNTRVLNPAENEKFKPTKETSEQYIARRQAEKEEAQKSLAAREASHQAFLERQAAREASHQAFLQRQARRKASHKEFLEREARREQQRANGPQYHTGGAYEKTVRPGQYTRTGMHI